MKRGDPSSSVPLLAVVAMTFAAAALAAAPDPSVAIASVFTPLPCTPFESRSFPNDVPDNHPFCAWIEDIADYNVTEGCAAGSYCPKDAVSREQLAKMLSQAIHAEALGGIFCADLGNDCTAPAGVGIDVSISLLPLHPVNGQTVRIWLANGTGLVSAVNTVTIQDAVVLEAVVTNGHFLVIPGTDTDPVIVTPLLNSPGTRFLKVEVEHVIFTSPVLTWN